MGWDRPTWRAPALAALLTLAGVVSVVSGLVALVVPPFVNRLGDLGSSVQDGLQRLAYSLGHDLAGMDHAAVDHELDRAAGGVRSHLGGLAGDAVTGATAVASGLAGAVLVVFLTFFMLKDGTRLWGWIVSLVPDERRPGLWEVGRRAWAALATYARGVMFVATVDAVCIGAALRGRVSGRSHRHRRSGCPELSARGRQRNGSRAHGPGGRSDAADGDRRRKPNGGQPPVGIAE